VIDPDAQIAASFARLAVPPGLMTEPDLNFDLARAALENNNAAMPDQQIHFILNVNSLFLNKGKHGTERLHAPGVAFNGQRAWRAQPFAEA
jgi:hypothetical protein